MKELRIMVDTSGGVPPALLPLMQRAAGLQIDTVLLVLGAGKDMPPAPRVIPVADPDFPYVITTYRLTEHYLSGAMSRWLPALSELMPELFIEISPELAEEKGIANLDWVRISTPRAQIRAKALVTRRLRPLQIDGRTVHQVGMPWHWGYEGVVTGDVVNELTALVGDPNVSIHEGKAFVCNVERA